MTHPQMQILQRFAHDLGAPLCALEVVLAAKHHLPPPQADLLEEAVVRLRQMLQCAQAESGETCEKSAPRGET